VIHGPHAALDTSLVISLPALRESNTMAYRGSPGCLMVRRAGRLVPLAASLITVRGVLTVPVAFAHEAGGDRGGLTVSGFPRGVGVAFDQALAPSRGSIGDGSDVLMACFTGALGVLPRLPRRPTVRRGQP
jgi:hypothetical protein